MQQEVKVTIRWRDMNGDVVGAQKFVTLDLPKWGKWSFMRRTIADLLDELVAVYKQDSFDSARTLRDYILDAFSIDRIIQIKCRTQGSYLSLKDERLEKFISDYKGGVYADHKTQN